MRYIDKHYDTSEVQLHNQALKDQLLDEQSLHNPEVYPGWTGVQLYEKVRDMETLQALKDQMYREQGGVCCYCGMKLEYPFDPQYRVEHVRPKEFHRELVGEYKNLLLSCKANKDEVKLREETIKKERKKFIHCDEAKGSTEITNSPLVKSCETAFSYALDGTIRHNNEEAKKDIETLGLAGPYLTRRRKNAIDSLFAGGELLSEEDMTTFKKGLQNRNANGKFAEFYFVLIDAINQLLPTV